MGFPEGFGTFRAKANFQSSIVNRIWLSSAVGTLSLKERNRAFSRLSLLAAFLSLRSCFLKSAEMPVRGFAFLISGH